MTAEPVSARRRRRRRRPATEEIPEQLPPSALMAEAVTRVERARYRGAGVRVGDSSVLHDVAWFTAPGGNEVPGPRCGAGGANPSRLSPGRAGRRCVRCGRMKGPADAAAQTGFRQGTLF